MVACPRGAVIPREFPPPAGSYIPHGQWSESVVEEPEAWKELLLVRPEGLWAMRTVPMTHLAFEGTAGSVLDAVVFRAAWAAPPPASPFRNLAEYEPRGAAFVVDETITGPGDLAALGQPAPEAPRTAGAHAVRTRFPLVFSRATASVPLWIALAGRGRNITRALEVTFTAEPTGPVRRGNGGEAPPDVTIPPSERPVGDIEPITEAPTIERPREDATVEGEVHVSGKARPGTLTVAWLQFTRPDGRPGSLPPVRHIADEEGRFEIVLRTPAPEEVGGEGRGLELHVRTEAPGYQSPETVRSLSL
jgi:hypothetical protein